MLSGQPFFRTIFLPGRNLRPSHMSRGKQSKEAEAIDDPFVSLHAIPARKNDHQCNSHLFIRSSASFIPQMPADIELIPISRTVGVDRIVDEMVVRLTHSVDMDWFLPGIPATGKRVEFPMVVIVQRRDGKMAAERIYWDQASVLVQLGLLDASTLPVAGAEVARKVLNPSLPSNELIRRARKR
ncbi:ester cyclase [Ktedonobacter sp. SOSP1-85]|uniref:ester cyclase n=1 Tax=Ktedonobacter sp. SOSP1-85 TaxID=2778367 RepID=UPI001F1E5A43|nr:ester cyclase [Ktedonobacter sp. SOSP1-85]